MTEKWAGAKWAEAKWAEAFSTAKRHYLIRNGTPVGATYACATPLRLENGVTFAANTPPQTEGRFIHHGQRINLIQNSENLSLAPWDPNAFGVTVTSNATTAPDGTSLADKIEPGIEGRSPWILQTYTTVAGATFVFDFYCYSDDTATTARAWAYGNVNSGQRFSFSKPLAWELFSFPFVNDDGDTFNRIGFTEVGDPGLYLFGLSLTQGKYSYSPIYIATEGGAASIDTAASSAADMHGLTWDLREPENNWAWDLLDGVPGEEKLTNGSFDESLFGWNQSTANYWVWTATGAYCPPTDIYRDITQALSDGKRCQIEYTVDQKTSDGTGLFFYRKVDTGVIVIDLKSGLNSYKTRARTGVDLLGFSRKSGFTCEMFAQKVSAKNIAHASGVLSLKNLLIKPSLTQWQTTVDKLNLISRNDGWPFLYVDNYGFLAATDGVNTCKAAIPYTPGTPFNAVLAFSEEGQMRIDIDGLKGTPANFKGTFLDGSPVLKFGLANEDLVMPGTISGWQGLSKLPPSVLHA